MDANLRPLISVTLMIIVHLGDKGWFNGRKGTLFCREIRKKVSFFCSEIQKILIFAPKIE